MHDMDETLVTTQFEACAEYRSPHHEAECEACGWLEGDHLESDRIEVVLAEVIPVHPWAEIPLRRAS